jgi:uncharacterized protein with HEPN domain
MNKLTTTELLNFILESLQIIKHRFVGINSSDDFLFDDNNLTKLDAILMRLQATGEAIKNLDKRSQELLQQVAPLDYWSKMIRMRDLISHHYTDLQADSVYEICTKHLEKLEQNILKLKELL